MGTFTFIDASNLFYGGEKSLGWKIDYRKLLNYLRKKYTVEQAFYFGGVELHKFPYDYLKQETVPINELENYLTNLIKNQGAKMNEARLVLMERHLQRIRFYQHLEKFGFILYLKPVKSYTQDDGEFKRKANCDVDMAFHLMKEKDNFDKVLILSGDGDFLPVLKYLQNIGKEIIILARGNRTAKEIKQLVGGNFKDFVRLKKDLEFEERHQ